MATEGADADCRSAAKREGGEWEGGGEKGGEREIFRQGEGIGIGSSCSGTLANLTLLMGEIDMLDKLESKAYYQAFFWVLIDLIVELLGLIIKPFDNQTES